MKKIIAKILHFIKIKPKYSTGIHGKTTCGYGELDEFGFWQYPLSNGLKESDKR